MEKRKLQASDIDALMNRYQFTDETRKIIENENLLPLTLLQRLHDNFPHRSLFLRDDDFYFKDKNYYSGMEGFRQIVTVLNQNGIDIGHIKEREFFIDVYRFMATKHVLNAINWKDYENDSMYHLVFPQPGMIKKEDVEPYLNATTEAEKARIVEEYQKKTNPHDGKQKLNHPWYINDEGELEVLKGSQHKYPQVALVFDKTTQNCFAFCNYCFRHAQVRGDEDMFVQDNVKQLHDYLKNHKEVTDVLITGGDGGFITYERLNAYLTPIMEDPELGHIKNFRIGSRALSFHPELVLTAKYKPILELLKKASDHGIQPVWVSHFSTPKEVINLVTIAAIRRLKAHGVTCKSQSPIMRHISLFENADGTVDIERSARNWVDLGNIIGMLGVGFHSMYCARPTGEHHYFTTPLIDIHKVFTEIFKRLPSINRPSRYITMTSSAGKISLLGTTQVNGETAFALKINEGRNMDWLDQVYLAKFDDKQNSIEKLKPYQGEKHFFEDELHAIEKKLEENLLKEMNKKH